MFGINWSLVIAMGAAAFFAILPTLVSILGDRAAVKELEKLKNK